MGLLSRKSQGDRLRRARRSHAGPAPDVAPALDALLAELGLDAERRPEGWAVDLGEDRVLVTWHADERVLSGGAVLGPVEGVDALAERLRANLEPGVVWSSLDAKDPAGPLAVRFRMPLDGWSRDAVLLGLEGAAAAVGAPELVERLHRARVASGGGERAEQEDHARVRGAVGPALEALEVQAAERHDRPGVWRLSLDRGEVEAVLRDTGESLLLLHEVPADSEVQDEAVLRWLLQQSDWSAARLGLEALPGGPVLFVACALPAAAVTPAGLAFGLEQLLTLADDYAGKAA